MPNSQNNTLNSDQIDLLKFFNEPASERQRQYEAVRAFIKERAPAKMVAQRFNYKITTVYSLVRDAKDGKLNLFPEVKKGPNQRTTSKDVQDKIICYRKQNLSSCDIHQRLATEGIKASVRTIERILQDAGFARLKRRTYKELGITKKKKIIPERSENLDFSSLEPFNIDCPVAGVFFFLPYIIDSGLIDVVKKCELPESSVIGSTQASLSMLLLKLIGNERLSHMDRYDQEPAFGIFAGLNMLPKSMYMNTYSCRTSEQMLLEFQKELISRFRQIYPQLYRSDFINLDFHSIAHFGTESEMEKVWCGARGKAMKGACTIFAQDAYSNLILYTRADILRKEEASEIKRFISYWKKIKGAVNETLVFDCKFTKYKVLDEMAEEGIKFITLRKRNQQLIEDTLAIPKKEWKKIRLPVPKRKYCNLSVYENEITLKGCKNALRQIIVKDHGRENPTYIVTNNKELSLTPVLEVYVKRWHIETKLAELVSFFNLNALSSSLMIRIHFDVLWTIIADTLYHRFAQDLRRFEHNLAPTIFKKFINMPGRLVFDVNKFMVKIRKRAHTPILKEVEKLKSPFPVPWLNNMTVEIVWTA
ncbi:MAG: transposase [Candidatus Bathyarchaeota archaeon]|nr:transposase [Candidatus Bathyarchaeota archaeon]